MESEKVKEIKKALECCSNPSCTRACPLSGYHSDDYKTLCRDKLVKDSLTLINDLESKLEAKEIYYNAVKNLALEVFANRVKMEFYYEFDEIIPSIMSDKIDKILKELIWE